MVTQSARFLRRVMPFTYQNLKFKSKIAQIAYSNVNICKDNKSVYYIEIQH